MNIIRMARIGVVCGALVIGLRSTLFAQVPVSGQHLEIGPASSNQVVGYHYGAAIGSGNSVDAYLWGSLAVGINNVVGLGPSLAVGSDNSLWGAHNAAFGNFNSVEGEHNIAFGAGHWFEWSSERNSYASMAVGLWNTVSAYGTSCFIAGDTNYIDGRWVPSLGTYDSVESATLLGKGLIGRWSHATVVGCYNNTPLTSLLFAVGNGQDSNTRSNAIEVYKDGTIKMQKAQGDISMGEFGLQ